MCAHHYYCAFIIHQLGHLSFCAHHYYCAFIIHQLGHIINAHLLFYLFIAHPSSIDQGILLLRVLFF